MAKDLVSCVVNLTKEILILTGISIRSKPEGKNSQMTNKENRKKTQIINSEPFIGTLGSNSSRTSEDGRGSTGNGSHDSLRSGI